MQEEREREKNIKDIYIYDLFESRMIRNETWRSLWKI